MISEVTFSKNYTSFWNAVLINSRNYVRLINGSLVQTIHKPFPPNNGGYTAYINEVAFELFSISLDNGNISFRDEDITNACSKLTKTTKHAKRNFWLNDVCTCHGLLPSHSA